MIFGLVQRKFFKTIVGKKSPFIYHQKTGANGDGNRIFFAWEKNFLSYTETFFHHFQVGEPKNFHTVQYSRTAAVALGHFVPK